MARKHVILRFLLGYANYKFIIDSCSTKSSSRIHIPRTIVAEVLGKLHGSKDYKPTY